MPKGNNTFDNGIFSTKAYLCNKYGIRSRSFTNEANKGKNSQHPKKCILKKIMQKCEVNRKKDFTVGIFPSDTE